MEIGLWSDCHNFPSLPLMKLSAYHKAIGDTVEHYLPLNHYDLVYASKVFSFTPDIDDTCIVQADEVRRGGTGYCISVQNGKEVFDRSRDTPLPKEIEHIYPDYDLYPDYKYAVGFLTRGCPRGCGFCIVGSKEGRCSHQVADPSEFWRGQREIKLLDPNLLACKCHVRGKDCGCEMCSDMTSEEIADGALMELECDCENAVMYFCGLQVASNNYRLKAYEDTGVSPEEIQEMLKRKDWLRIG